ncbi:oligosaccharide flippase family protein [Cellulophaga baltica]|uniref:oligosaccharide flippase family protein n=1 Tax=Cellulophaga baltica TaxID=76594 RepID=UPI0015F45F19|nr:oligosaccharide flippase family protein [Cellulophaga baltica]MBA6314708.1 oligosaccharide flippase family protein [Cellulophaga baltica]
MHFLINKLTKNKLFQDSFWSIIGNVFGKGLSLLAGIIIARLLGKEIYGEYGIIKSTLLSLAILSSFGLGYTSTKFIAENKTTYKENINQIIKTCLKTTTISSGILTLILFLFAKDFARYALKAPELYFEIRLTAVFIFFNSISITQIGILAGFGKFKKLAQINTFVGIFTIISSCLLTLAFNFKGALIALVLTQVINFGLNYYYINKERGAYNSNDNSKELEKKILKFSIPIALQEAFYSVITWSFGVLLIRFSTFGELGIYSAAMQWNAMILFIPGILRNVVLSHMSYSKDNKEHGKILNSILIFNLTVTLIISLIFYACSDFITKFYGDNFEGLKQILNITVFTTIFASLSNVYSQAYLSKDKNWLMLGFRVLRDSSILLMTYLLLINSKGSLGALSLAYSTLIMNIAFLILMGIIYKYKIKDL